MPLVQPQQVQLRQCSSLSCAFEMHKLLHRMLICGKEDGMRRTYLVSTDKKQQTHGLLNRLVGDGRCCERLNLTALLERMVCLCHLLRLNSLLCTAELIAFSVLNHTHP